MFKKFAVFISSVILLLNICGCVALIAGSVAGGAGTAVWLSGKLVQNVDAPLERVEKAAKDSLEFRNRAVVTKETIFEGHAVAQIRSRETSGERIRIVNQKLSDTRSRIEVRVGTIVSNKDAADRILKEIVGRL
jgi:hypothetical protein